MSIDLKEIYGYPFDTAYHRNQRQFQVYTDGLQICFVTPRPNWKTMVLGECYKFSNVSVVQRGRSWVFALTEESTCAKIDSGKDREGIQEFRQKVREHFTKLSQHVNDIPNITSVIHKKRPLKLNCRINAFAPPKNSHPFAVLSINGTDKPLHLFGLAYVLFIILFKRAEYEPGDTVTIEFTKSFGEEQLKYTYKHEIWKLPPIVIFDSEESAVEGDIILSDSEEKQQQEQNSAEESGASGKGQKPTKKRKWSQFDRQEPQVSDEDDVCYSSIDSDEF